MSDVQKTVLEFIKENFIMGRSEVALALDESLIESGVMDSTGVLSSSNSLSLPIR